MSSCSYYPSSKNVYIDYDSLCNECKVINSVKIACLLDVKPIELFCVRHIYLLAMSIHKISKIRMDPKA
jgi:hypothetical protein